MQNQANGALAILGQVPAGVVYMAAPTIEALRTRQADIQAASQALIEAADEAGEDLSDEALATIEANREEALRIGRQIQAREAVGVTATAGRRTQPDEAARSTVGQVSNTAGRPTVPAQPRANDPRGGFTNFGEFATAVRHASRREAPVVDNRLSIQNATLSTYGQEGVGADGGWAVPPEFRAAIMEKVQGPDSLLSRCDVQVTSSNNMSFPVDETTAWQSTGGIQAYWEGEAAAMTQSKPALQDRNLRLHKLTALVPVTEELLADVPSMDAYLRSKAPQKIDYKVSNAIYDGTGVGQPLGVLNANCTVTVSKETSQPADTFLSENIFKMWSRMYAPCRRNAVWLINQDAEPQLYNLQIHAKNVAQAENVSGIPVYVPPGGINGAPYGTLMGRPVIAHEVCKTIGDKGDIMLADFSKYLAVIKAGGIRTDSSIHLFFDQDVTAFRFIFRVAGQPWWESAISRANGTNTLSSFVVLEAR